MLVDGGTPHENALIDRHFEYLQDLTARGTAKLVGRTLTTGKDTFGIIIFEAASEDAALCIMQADPAFSGGVMQAELFPFRIILRN